jgi:uncharacterized protein YhfF
MNTQDLIQKLEARGITLSLCGKNLHYTAAKPIPAGIVTTIEAHRRVLTKYLKAPKEAGKPTRVDAEPADSKTATVVAVLTEPAEAAEPAEPKKQFRNIPFKFTAQQLLSGAKTQTRRRPDKHTTTWQAGEIFTALGEHDEVIAHIKALAIRKQRLGEMTEDEACAEGFEDLAAFRAEWIKYYRVFDAALEVLVLEFRVLPAAELKTGTAVPVLTELPELSEPAQPDKHVSQHASFTDLAVDFLEATERILVTWKDERPPVLRTPQLKRELAAVENALSAYRAVLLPDDPESRAVGESLANRYRGLN